MRYQELLMVIDIAEGGKESATKKHEEIAWGNLKQTAQYLLKFQDPPEKEDSE
jgi:hypothetical protein